MATQDEMLKPGDPHLLKIPREIRDQIYSYLHTSIRLHHTSLPHHHVLHREPSLLLTNVPSLSVLLTHSRLHEEYTKVLCSNDITLRIGLKACTAVNRSSGSINDKARARAALAHVRNLVIDMTEFSISPLIRFPWSYCKIVLDKILNFTPLLRTLHCIDSHVLSYHDSETLAISINSFRQAPQDIRFLPSQIGHLSLRWRGTGRTVLYGRKISALGPEHEITEFSIYTYTTATLPEHVSTSTEALALLNPVCYPEEVLEDYKLHYPGLLAVLPNKAFQWHEARFD